MVSINMENIDFFLFGLYVRYLQNSASHEKREGVLLSVFNLIMHALTVNCKLTPRKYAGEIYAAETITSTDSHTQSLDFGPFYSRRIIIFLSLFYDVQFRCLWSCGQEMFLLTNAK